MLYLFILLLLIVVLISMYFQYKAINNLSEKYKSRKFDVVFKYGLFAGRKCFNEIGWKYKNMIVLMAVLGFIIIIIASIVMYANKI